MRLYKREAPGHYRLHTAEPHDMARAQAVTQLNPPESESIGLVPDGAVLPAGGLRMSEAGVGDGRRLVTGADGKSLSDSTPDTATPDEERTIFVRPMSADPARANVVSGVNLITAQWFVYKLCLFKWPGGSPSEARQLRAYEPRLRNGRCGIGSGRSRTRPKAVGIARIASKNNLVAGGGVHQRVMPRSARRGY